MAQYISWSQGYSTSLYYQALFIELYTLCISELTLWTFISWYELFLTVLSDSQVYYCFLNSFICKKELFLHFKVQWLSPTVTLHPIQGQLWFHHLGNLSTQFHISIITSLEHIYQRGWSSPRFPTYTIQPAQIVLPVPGPSIILTDNDPNWENNSITNLTTNRPNSSTHSQLKLHHSNNTNK